MKIRIPLAILTLMAVPCTAQVQVDREVVLEGATPADRRVQGLADGANEGDALNARSLQAGGYRFAEASGGADNWTITLDPEPSAIVAGTKLQVKAAFDNTGPVTIAVNALGTYDVLKNGSQPLEAGDVSTNEVATLLFDGNGFQLLSARRLERRPCPAGFAQVNDLFCIEQAERDTLNYYDAALVCAGLDARLCSWGQWYAACTHAAVLGLTNMVGNFEWTNNAASAAYNVRIVGESVCSHAAALNGYDFTLNFRCCYKR